ncbi:hypothetical protein ACFXKC_42070 [Streptomyces sp. NPDC059340]|uniref:hypothetical protein n=1 Tax=Streptomyces sp. NPDC059340 TaxID=3346806 RepID=UPI0036C38502
MPADENGLQRTLESGHSGGTAGREASGFTSPGARHGLATSQRRGVLLCGMVCFRGSVACVVEVVSDPASQLHHGVKLLGQFRRAFFKLTECCFGPPDGRLNLLVFLLSLAALLFGRLRLALGLGASWPPSSSRRFPRGAWYWCRLGALASAVSCVHVLWGVQGLSGRMCWRRRRPQ